MKNFRLTPLVMSRLPDSRTKESISNSISQNMHDNEEQLQNIFSKQMDNTLCKRSCQNEIAGEELMSKSNTMLKTLEDNYDKCEHCKDHQDENRTDSSSLADDIDESIYKNEMMQPARKFAYHGNDYEQSRCERITNREGCIEYDQKLGDEYFYRNDGKWNEDEKYGEEELYGEEVVETYKLPCKFLQTEKGVEVCHENVMDDFKLEGKEGRNAEKYLNLSSSEGIVRVVRELGTLSTCEYVNVHLFGSPPPSPNLLSP